MEESPLTFNNVDVYFIYSFLMNIERTLPDLCSELRKAARGNGANWTYTKPESRAGVSSNLKLENKDREIFKELKATRATFSTNRDGKEKEYRVKFGILSRISGTGTGTVTIKISLNNKNNIDSMDIHNILNLIDTGVYNVEDIPHLNVEGFPHSKNNEEKEGEHKSLKLFGYFGNECESLKIENFSKWLDTELINSEEARDWQNPYVVIVGDLKEKLLNDSKMWWKLSEKELRSANETKSKMKVEETVTLLLRFLMGKEFIKNRKHDLVHLPEGLQGKDTYLENFSWYNNIFIGFHSRASLILKIDDELKTGTMITKSLLDLMETLRARWHISVGLNELLDKDIATLKEEPSEDNLNFLKILINRRKQYTSFLGDSTAYTWEGGIVGDVCRRARRVFLLDHLTRMTTDKFNMVEKLYEDQMDYIRKIEFKNLQAKFSTDK